MHWEDLPETIDAWVEKCSAPGRLIKSAASNVITSTHVGYYFNPISAAVGIFAPMASVSDTALVKAAAVRATGTPPLFLSYQDLTNPNGSWVKVAYSPALRRAGELLNFFPGQYPGEIPNAPSPVSAMLTSGLLGAGLGWGGGKLIGSLLPEGHGKKLGRTGAIVGGMLGAMPGAAWGGTNRLAGKSFNDPSLLNHAANAEPINNAESINGTNSHMTQPTGEESSPVLDSIRDNLQNVPRFKIGTDLSGIELGKMYLTACEKVASTFGHREADHEYSPLDVNIDALGRTLWDHGASPHMAATTMGGVYAAHQMPDENARPGWVTANQFGQLAENAVGDYAKGYLVGAALNAVVGTPYRASSFGMGNLALGVIGAVVPKLFGG